MPNDLPASAIQDPPITNAKSGREVIAEAIKPLPYIGPALAAAIKNGSWGFVLLLVWLVWELFLYPLLLPALAAAWINAGVLRDARSTYAESVRQAFGVKEFADEIAQESNKRLDYVQVIEYDADSSQPQTYLLSVTRNQRVVYRIEHPQLYSEDKKCPVPTEVTSRNVKLFTLSFEETAVAEIRNGSHEPRSLTPAQWKAIIDKAGHEVDRLTIRIEPVPALAAQRCGKVKVRMRVLFEVYKNLVGASV